MEPNGAEHLLRDYWQSESDVYRLSADEDTSSLAMEIAYKRLIVARTAARTYLADRGLIELPRTYAVGLGPNNERVLEELND